MLNQFSIEWVLTVLEDFGQRDKMLVKDLEMNSTIVTTNRVSLQLTECNSAIVPGNPSRP